jgi:hypothetical protein
MLAVHERRAGIRLSMPVEDRDLAREYLQRELPDLGSVELQEAAHFEGQPLEGEGPMTVFTFRAALGGNSPADYCVVAGHTQPNYYPAWGLSPDEIYSLHLGTRFMLVLQPVPIPLDRLPASLEADFTRELARIVLGQLVSEFKPVAAFQVEAETHVIARCRIATEQVYVLGLDLPLGIYRRVDLPPNAVYRTHLGNVIRMEPDSAAEPAEG